MKEKILAIIPARGGSQGTPRKNIRLLAGKPLITYTIDQAVQTGLFDKIVVSTDDHEIREVAEKDGADVILRPPEISGDKSPTEEALLHVLDVLKNESGYEPDLVVFLQATSPLREDSDITRAVNELRERNADSCFSACPEHFTGRWRIDDQGYAQPQNYQLSQRPMRQDYPVEYLENGSIYVFKPWVLRGTGTRLGGKVAVSLMTLLDSVQIDSPDDLALAERLLQSRPQSRDAVDFAPVRLLVLDFDGVLTDNRVWVSEDGREGVLCHRGDGWGITRLQKTDVEVIVLSTESNPVVRQRCKKLNIACLQNSSDKLKDLFDFARSRDMGPEQIAYVGNDVNDLECMKWVSLPVAVRDAHPDVKKAARYLTSQDGGWGAVREVCDLILRQKGTAA